MKVKLFFLVVFVGASLSLPHYLNATPSPFDYEAIYIYNFTKYIYWANAGNKITIGVFGNSAAVLALKSLVSKKSSENLHFEIKHFQSVAQIGECNILFVTPDCNEILPFVKKKIQNKAVLLITENQTNAAISPLNMFWNAEHTRLDFTIDKEEVERLGMKVSAKLLRLAKND
jgi:hypothetical protein